MTADHHVAEPGSTGPAERPAPRPSRPACHDDVCVTCSDTAVAVTVLRLLPDRLAVVDTGQGAEEISVALVAATVGDTVLVHAREAIAVLPRDTGPGTAGRSGPPDHREVFP